MTEMIRPSPRYKTVSLFVTCMVDNLYPQTGISTVKLLEHVGAEVEFDTAQTCCGQPAFNAGFWDDARPVAKHFLDTYQDADLIVMPSGSCASMVQHYYPELFKHDERLHRQAVRLASITWELSEYLVDGLGIDDLGGSLPDITVGFHQACHGLRLGGLKDQAQRLVEHIEGVTIREVADSDTCCGFGGLFSVKMPEISGAMLKTKMAGIQTAEVDLIVTGDCGCQAQINGGLSRAGETPKVTHLADLLCRALGIY
jgi:L-lactate dehydrogenase complex protein LldE